MSRICSITSTWQTFSSSTLRPLHPVTTSQKSPWKTLSSSALASLKPKQNSSRKKGATWNCWTNLSRYAKASNWVCRVLLIGGMSKSHPCRSITHWTSTRERWTTSKFWKKTWKWWSAFKRFRARPSLTTYNQSGRKKRNCELSWVLAKARKGCHLCAEVAPSCLIRHAVQVRPSRTSLTLDLATIQFSLSPSRASTSSTTRIIISLMTSNCYKETLVS